jgi:ABC-type transport system substrate-binding protein
MEADGRHSITDIYIRHFTDDESRTTAALTGEIDFLSDTWRIAIVDLDAVKADPLLTYIPTILDPYISMISLRCEEGIHTPCPDFGGATPAMIWQMLAGFPMPAAINRTVRRALSYALDYETYLDVVGHGRGNVSTNILGLNSIFYDNAIPAPYTNLTKAREILLSDPYYASLCSARGLTINNNTAEWNWVALNDPIGTHNMVYNFGHETPIFVEAALNNIGFRFVGVPDTDFVTNFIGTGLLVTMDIWPFQVGISTTDPWATFNGIFYSGNRYIPYGKFNFQLFANDTIDAMLANIYTSDDPEPLYHQLANELQNYHNPILFCMQYQRGFAINSGWTYTASMQQRIGFREIPYYAWISGERMTTAAPPPIAGFDVYIISVASIFTLFGVIYAQNGMLPYVNGTLIEIL